ncbi:MAG: HAD-IIIA family hydrolase [Comamonas sp.]|nr:HAD-IIIA family hydrolase [Comamonas sp.]
MKLAIFDYLGTINPDSVGAVMHARLWQAQPGLLEAIAQLYHSGWLVAQAVNQPGLGRGSLEIYELLHLQQHVQRRLGQTGARMDAFFFCPHASEQACQCRKPQPGLLQQIAQRYGALATEIWVIGQDLSHLQAGHALGAHLVYVGTDAAQAHPQAQRFASWQSMAQALAALA